MITLNLVFIIPLYSFILFCVHKQYSLVFKLLFKKYYMDVFFCTLLFPQDIEIFFHEDTQVDLVYSFLVLFILLT